MNDITSLDYLTLEKVRELLPLVKYELVVYDEVINEEYLDDYYILINEELSRRFALFDKKGLCKNLKEYLKDALSLSLSPRRSGWHIVLSPIEMHNAIIGGYYNMPDLKLDFIDLEDKASLYYFNSIFDINLNIIYKKLLNNKDLYKENMNEYNSKINELLLFKKNWHLFFSDIHRYYLDYLLNNIINYDKLLLLNSIDSLNNLINTNEVKYSVLPKTYFKYEFNCNEDGSLSFNLNDDSSIKLKELFLNRFYNIFNYNESLFKNSKDNLIENVDNLIPFEYRLNLDSTFDYLNKKAFRNYRLNNNVDFDKLIIDNTIDLFNFYKGNNLLALLSGINNFNGYFGFVYSNDLVVIDKFFDVSGNEF